jgi:hypothetical protein
MRTTFRGLLFLAAVCALAAALYARLHAVHVYSLPAQRKLETQPVDLMLNIHENPIDDAWISIVSDILPAEKNGQWTWTNGRPHLRYRIEETDRWLFSMHFAAAGQVLKVVGPQTIEIAINGTTVKTVTAAEAHEYDVRFPIDPALLKRGAMNDVEVRISPAYVAEDGVSLGVLLHSIGFVENR